MEIIFTTMGTAAIMGNRVICIEKYFGLYSWKW